MGQSFVKNYIHLVFCTKYRASLIYPPYDKELHAYLGGICKKLECQPIRINGYRDHIHILCGVSPKIAVMKLVQELKSRSSKWMKTKDISLKSFRWQNGYAAFSVRPIYMDRLINYIDNQYEHHRRKDFQKELRRLLKKYQIEYDEAYVWD